MAKSLLLAGGSVTVGAGQTRYFSVGTGSESVVSATEDVKLFTVREAGTFSNGYVRVSTNGITNNSTLTLMKNGVATPLVITITGSTTGDFEDTTNSVSVVDGDTISWKWVGGASGSTQIINIWACTFTATTNTTTIFRQYLTNYNTASATRAFHLFASNFQTTANYALAGLNSATAGTWENLYVYVSANARTTNTVYGSLINGSTGNQSITISAGATGAFEDTTNTDSVSAGDIITYYITTGTGTETITPRILKSSFTTTNDSWLAGGQLNLTTASGTAYYPLSFPSGVFAEGNSESVVQADANIAFTASDLWAYCSSYTSGTSTITLRKNNADTALTIAVTGTGEFLDSTNDVSIVASDEVNYSIVSTGVAILRAMSMLGTTTITPATITGLSTVQGISTLTF